MQYALMPAILNLGPKDQISKFGADGCNSAVELAVLGINHVLVGHEFPFHLEGLLLDLLAYASASAAESVLSGKRC